MKLYKAFIIIALLVLGNVPAYADSELSIDGAEVGSDSSGAGVSVYTVATLPADADDGTLAVVTDGADTDDCVTGGGTDLNPCIYDEDASAWVIAGDGTSTGGGNSIFFEHGGSAVGDNDSANVTLDATEGLDLTCAGQDCLIKGEDATTSNKGIASFVSAFFSVASGAVSIISDGIQTANINWESVSNLEIQSAGINWADLTGSEIQRAGINWASVQAADIPALNYAAALGADDNYVTDAEKVVIGNTSGTNTGDQTLASLGVTATASEINVVDGITATVTELNYTDGVTSPIQTQLDAKQNTADDVTLADSKRIILDPVPASDHSATGIITTRTAGTTCAFGDVMFPASDGDYDLADADAAATLPGVTMCVASITATNSGEMLLQGYARDDTWAWTVGGLIYISTTGTTGNTLTQTVPSGDGDQVQVVGYAISADIMYFNPSPVLVEVDAA